jgi:uncharacterized membrane protein
MKNFKFTLLTAGFVLAMALTFSCFDGGGSKCDSSGRILIGGGITYERCQEVAEDHSGCTSGGLYSYEYNECKCYAESCEEE